MPVLSRCCTGSMPVVFRPVVVPGLGEVVSDVASAPKKLAKTRLLSCHDVFTELVVTPAQPHSPGKHYIAYFVPQ